MSTTENEKDPNDTRQISFVINKSESQWVDKRITALKEYDPGFYVRILEIGADEYLYKITTHQSNMEHETYKKFIFQLELRFGKVLKIR